MNCVCSINDVFLFVTVVYTVYRILYQRVKDVFNPNSQQSR